MATASGESFDTALVRVRYLLSDSWGKEQRKEAQNSAVVSCFSFSHAVLSFRAHDGDDDGNEKLKTRKTTSLSLNTGPL